MKRVGTLTALILAVVLIGTIACGGGLKNTAGVGTTIGHVAKNTATIFGSVFGGSVKKTTTASVFNPFMVTANAQVATPLVITGTFSGQCDTTSPGFEQVLYNAGKWNNADCFRERTGGDGAPVVGDGTLNGLAAFSSVSGTDATSGKVQVYVNNVLTSITCTIGQSKRCTDNVHTVAVKDNDAVTITVTMAGTDPSTTRIKALLGKQ